MPREVAQTQSVAVKDDLTTLLKDRGYEKFTGALGRIGISRIDELCAFTVCPTTCRATAR